MNLSWSARKLSPAFQRGGLILDVGSGGRPSPFAHVLLEKFPDNATKHRFHTAKFDRPTVIGDAQKMPFKDKAFAYSIAYHVLEHMDDPSAMLTELGRVSMAGYIETPNTLHESLFPYPEHKWVLDFVAGEIQMSPKQSMPVPEHYYGSTSYGRLKSLRRKSPEIFHMQSWWKGAPRFAINTNLDGPDSDASSEVNQLEASLHRSSSQRKINDVINGAAKIFRKSVSFELVDILCCVECGASLDNHQTNLRCTDSICKAEYPIDPFPDFTNAQ